MAVWPGLGVNYKSQNASNIASDIAYFKALGLRYIRVHIPAFNGSAPWNSSTYAEWRALAKQFTDAGFTVLAGLSWGNVLNAEWQRWHDHNVAEAQYCAQNNVCAEFNIGNELELHLNDITEAELVTRTKQIATAVKAVAPKLKVVYTMAAFGSHPSFWVNAGRGDVDYITGNVYGNYGIASGVYNKGNYKTNIPLMQAAFGENWYISEFNVDATAANFNVMPEDRKESELGEMLKFIKESGVSRAYVYQYRSTKDNDAGDSFFLRRNDGDFRLAWNPIATNNGRRIYVP